MKLPLYVRLDKVAPSSTGGTPSIQIGHAGRYPGEHIASSIITLKLELDIDETMFTNGVMDTGATIKIGPASIDAATIVAGLKQIDKDIKAVVV